MIVADASLLVNFYMGEQALAMTVLQRDLEWHTTPLWRFEMRNALVKYIRVGRLTIHEAESIMIKAAVIIGDRVRGVSAARVFQSATTHEISAYDADYVALAQELGVPLITFDQRLVRAARGIALSPADFVR